MMMKWSEIPFGPECNTACSPWMGMEPFFPALRTDHMAEGHLSLSHYLQLTKLDIANH